jgi:hypothetical protein
LGATAGFDAAALDAATGLGAAGNETDNTRNPAATAIFMKDIVHPR